MIFKTSTLSQCEYSSTFKDMDEDVEKDDGDVSRGYIFLNIHTLYQFEDSGTLKETDGYFEKGFVGSVYGSINIHNDLQQNGLK